MNPWEKDKVREVSVGLTESQLAQLRHWSTRGVSALVRRAVAEFIERRKTAKPQEPQS